MTDLRRQAACTRPPDDSGVPDLKPPRLNAGERATLHALLQYQRDSLVRKVTGVDESAARRSAVGTGTTLLWLVKHLTRAEILWIAIPATYLRWQWQLRAELS